MNQPEDTFFANLPSQHAHIARAGAEEDEIFLPAFAGRFLRLESEWLPLRWQPEAMTLAPVFRDALIAFATRQSDMADTILSAVSDALPALSQTYGQDLAAAYGAGLSDAVVPLAVTFHEVRQTVFTGIELDCDWDPESGLGLLLRGGQPMGVGSADVAFSPEVARAAAAGDAAPFRWTPNAP